MLLLITLFNIERVHIMAVGAGYLSPRGAFQCCERVMPRSQSFYTDSTYLRTLIPEHRGRPALRADSGFSGLLSLSDAWLTPRLHLWLELEVKS